MSNSDLLDKKLCEKLAQSASLTIGHDVLITDSFGYVVASNDPDRVDSLHEASLEVIQSARKIYHDAAAARKFAGTKPGITIPIIIDSIVIGTIGITGAPHEISQYALLIQQLAQIFLDFEKRQRSTTRTDYRKKNLLREIITYDSRSHDEAAICESAYEFGIDLNAARIAVKLEEIKGRHDDASEETRVHQAKIMECLLRHFDHPQDFVCPQNNTGYVVFAFGLRSIQPQQYLEMLQQKCLCVSSECLTVGIRLRIGIGFFSHSVETLRQSYENACFALKSIHAGIRNSTCLYIGDVVLEKIAASLPDGICSEISAQMFGRVMQAKNRKEVLLTIEHWFQQRFNFVQTAQALHIHKSTLVYRFRRIRETCGLDMYDLDKVLAIYLLDIRHKLCGQSDSRTSSIVM
ncbi:sugar diacid recognition domain-containing protein [Agathobaculum massiliense]|uniref:sugar diacid recognition domain-containing protein n=1 Tax=Agathobaculum massiliense TaxID=3014267 RepID=UPI0036F2414A